MIIYDLVCDSEHRFEGWFKSSDDYTVQQAQSLICCPVCESTQVHKMPSASYIQRSRTSPNRTLLAPPVVENRNGNTESTASDMSPGQVQQVVKQFRDFVLNKTEDVGSSFAEESRKMHYGEATQRNIRGEATADEFASLRDEGIQAIPLPGHWVSKKQLN